MQSSIGSSDLRTLVIETATEACSVALLQDGAVLAATHEIVLRGHAERLIPMIAALPGGGRADHILVDCGPGSFTGVRVGLAAARGLAFGWGTTLAGFSSMALVAAHGFDAAGGNALAVILEGGHGEVFMQGFAFPPLRATSQLASLAPDAAVAALGTRRAVGTGGKRLATATTPVTIDPTHPDARHAILLPPVLAALPPVPIYGRAPDAKPQS